MNKDTNIKIEDNRISSLISLLDAEDWKFRRSAAENLANMGQKILPYLVEALGINNENYHYWGLKVLQKLKLADLEAIDILAKVFRIGNENSRLFVINYLKQMPIYASQRILKLALDDQNWIIRKEAINIFEIHGQSSLPYLQSLIAEGNDNQKYWAMRCLGMIMGGDAVEPLNKILNSKNYRLHHLAVMALGETKSPAAIPLLIKCLTSKIWLVRKEAEEVLISLGRSKSETVRDETIKLLNTAFNNTKADDVRFSIIFVIGSITGGDAGVFLRKILNHKDENMRYFAVKTLGEMTEGADIDLLLSKLSDSNWIVRKKAAEIIVQKGENWVPRIATELVNPSEDVSYWAMTILMEMGQAGLCALKDFSNKTESRALKLTLLDRLASKPLEDTIDILLGRLSDPHWMVRQKAAEIIASWGEGAIPQILKILPETIMNQDRLYWLGDILERLGPKGKEVLYDLLGTYHVKELPEIFSAPHIEYLIARIAGSEDRANARACRGLLFQAPRIMALNIAFSMFEEDKDPKTAELIVSLIVDPVLD